MAMCSDAQQLLLAWPFVVHSETQILLCPSQMLQEPIWWLHFCCFVRTEIPIFEKSMSC